MVGTANESLWAPNEGDIMDGVRDGLPAALSGDRGGREGDSVKTLSRPVVVAVVG